MACIKYAITNLKGGCGKTSTALALASGLSQRGFKVLLVDADAQKNATLSSIKTEKATLYDILENGAEPEQAISSSEIGYDVLCGDLRLAYLELEDVEQMQETLKQILKKYDYCIYDCSPSMNSVTRSVLLSADKLIIPSVCEYFSVQGLAFYINLLNQEKVGSKIDGILVTQKEKNAVQDAFLDQIKNISVATNIKLYNSVIRKTVSVPRAAALKMDIFTAEPKATATADYIQFIDEVLRG